MFLVLGFQNVQARSNIAVKKETVQAKNKNDEEIKIAVENVIRDFDKKQKDEVYKNFLRDKNKNLEKIKDFYGYDYLDEKEKNSEETKDNLKILQFMSEDTTRNLIYNSKITLDDIEYLDKNRAKVDLKITYFIGDEAWKNSLMEFLHLKSDNKLENRKQVLKLLNDETRKKQFQNFFDKKVLEIMKKGNFDDLELFEDEDIELNFEKTNGKWETKDTILKEIMKMLQ